MPSPCLLFLGPEAGEKQEAIDDIRRTLQGAEETSFYAGETPLDVIVSVLRNASLFAEKRLVFLKSAECIKKNEADALAAYMIDPHADTTLILLSDENSLAKALENAVPPSAKRIFWELFENRKREWLVSFFRQQGRRISEDGIETVLELVENNTGALRRECSQLCQFLDKAALITGEEVEKWLAHSREESAFTLFSRIAAGDLARSLETLHSLLMAKESPQGILAGLAWCFQRLRDYLFLLEGGVANDFELKKIGLSSARARKDYECASRRYTIWSVDRCLSLTAAYDVHVRAMGGALETLLMDCYIYKVYMIALAP
jgi:DNA polymerase-3 subunit delta